MAEVDPFDFGDPVDASLSTEPILQLCVAGLAAWGILIALRKSKKNQPSAARRKHREAFTRNHVDNQIDARNIYSKKLPKINPNVPFFSRHNYNRRRRPVVV